MGRVLGVVAVVVLGLVSSCTSGDGTSAEEAVVAALDDMRDGLADEAWATLHPLEQRRTNAAAFAECVASGQLAPDAEKPEHRVKAVQEAEDSELAGNAIAGPARRVTIEYWDSEAKIRGGGPLLDYYAFRVGGSWRWADPHLDVSDCTRLSLD